MCQTIRLFKMLCTITGIRRTVPLFALYTKTRVTFLSFLLHSNEVSIRALIWGDVIMRWCKMKIKEVVVMVFFVS